MKRKIGYPKTKTLLRDYGYDPGDILIAGFNLFTHKEYKDAIKSQPPLTVRNNWILALVIYPVFLWEKFRNLH